MGEFANEDGLGVEDGVEAEAENLGALKKLGAISVKNGVIRFEIDVKEVSKKLVKKTSSSVDDVILATLLPILAQISFTKDIVE